MPVYTYKCRTCFERAEIFRPIDSHEQPPHCHICGSHMRRDYRTDKPQPAPVWQSHFNPTTGTIVSDRKQMQSDMDRASDALYERTGIEQRNVVIDRADMKALKHDSAE